MIFSPLAFYVVILILLTAWVLWGLNGMLITALGMLVLALS